MSKSNVRSFRYSNEVKAILEKYNNDFDCLVSEAFLLLPEAQKKRDILIDECLNLEVKRNNLLTDIRKIESIYSALTNLKHSIDYYADSIKKM